MFYVVIIGWGVGFGGEIVDIFLFFVVGVLYLILFVVLGLGGIYYVVCGLEILEDYFFFFGYDWKDKN